LGAEESVHLRQFPQMPSTWKDADLAAKWEQIRAVRRVVTGALEIERREKRIGSSLDAAPDVYIEDDDLRAVIESEDLAEIAITSQIAVHAGTGPDDAFRISEIAGVAVVSAIAEGQKCACSWKTLRDVGSDADYPELSARDADAVRQWDALAALQ